MAVPTGKADNKVVEGSNNRPKRVESAAAAKMSMSNGSLSRTKSMSSGSKSINVYQPMRVSNGLAMANTTPCAATASIFLYAQGSLILCLHHDTLAVDRKFDRHRADVEFIAVDNVSERGAGRLVVSYDVGQTAIVWDLFTGQEVSRFASIEHIGVASWMRNGNVAFGTKKAWFCEGDGAEADLSLPRKR